MEFFDAMDYSCVFFFGLLQNDVERRRSTMPIILDEMREPAVIVINGHAFRVTVEHLGPITEATEQRSVAPAAADEY